MNFQHTRFDIARPLTEDEIFKKAPSVFAREAHQSRSERFKPIATIDVVRALAKEGFQVASASQSLVRVPDRAPFTKHLLRLRQFDRVNKVDDVIAEMALKNANDGTGAYDLMSALHRIRCLNGLFAAMGELSSCRVRHTGDVVTKVIEGTYSVIEQSTKALQAVPAWSGIQLQPEERTLLARAAHTVRFDHDGTDAAIDTVGITPGALLNVRRWDDRSSDLWTTWNVIQENCTKGGLSARRVDKNGNLRRSSTREVKGVDQTVGLNRALWMIANAFAEERGVKIAA